MKTLDQSVETLGLLQDLFQHYIMSDHYHDIITSHHIQLNGRDNYIQYLLVNLQISYHGKSQLKPPRHGFTQNRFWPAYCWLLVMLVWFYTALSAVVSSVIFVFLLCILRQTNNLLQAFKHKSAVTAERISAAKMLLIAIVISGTHFLCKHGLTSVSIRIIPGIM